MSEEYDDCEYYEECGPEIDYDAIRDRTIDDRMFVNSREDAIELDTRASMLTKYMPQGYQEICKLSRVMNNIGSNNIIDRQRLSEVIIYIDKQIKNKGI